MFYSTHQKRGLLYKLLYRIFSICGEFKTEAVVQRCSVEKVFLEILQNSQEHFCARVSFLRCLPVNFAKFLRTPFLQNTSRGCFCKDISIILQILLICVLRHFLINYLSHCGYKIVLCSVFNIMLQILKLFYQKIKSMKIYHYIRRDNE